MNKVNVMYNNGSFFFEETKDIVNRNQFVNEMLNRKYDNVIASSDEKNTKIQFILNSREIIVTIPRDEMVLINRLENVPVKDKKVKSTMSKKAAIGATVAALAGGSIVGYNTIGVNFIDQFTDKTESDEFDETSQKIVDGIFRQLVFLRHKLEEDQSFDESIVSRLLNDDDNGLRKLALRVYNYLMQKNLKSDLLADMNSSDILVKINRALDIIASNDDSLVKKNADDEEYNLDSVNARVTIKSR